MKRTTSARVAGVTFLLYIIVGIGQMFVGRGATTGETTAAKLASVAQHATQMRVNLVLTLVVSFIALTLAVSLYAITRDEDRDVALLALVCRVLEGGVTTVIGVLATLSVLWLAGSTAPDASASYPVAAILLKARGWMPLVAAIFFAVGSTLFCSLLLRGRMIPSPLAWLGVAASILLVVMLPLELIGVLHQPATQLMWIPMAAFEIVLAVWLLARGVPEPRARQ